MKDEKFEELERYINGLLVAGVMSQDDKYTMKQARDYFNVHRDGIKNLFLAEKKRSYEEGCKYGYTRGVIDSIKQVTANTRQEKSFYPHSLVSEMEDKGLTHPYDVGKFVWKTVCDRMLENNIPKDSDIITEWINNRKRIDNLDEEE